MPPFRLSLDLPIVFFLGTEINPLTNLVMAFNFCMFLPILRSAAAE